MKQKLGRIAAGTMTSAGALMLVSCATNAEIPATFAATVTVTGEADEVSADSGVCTVGSTRLAPNDEVGLYGESAGASTKSALEVESIDQNSDGTGVCTYRAHFNDVPESQRGYQLLVGGDFVERPFTVNELKRGVTHVVQNSAPQ